MGKQYRVISSSEVAGKKRGQIIDPSKLSERRYPGIVWEALIEGGHVEEVKPGDKDAPTDFAEQKPVACEACQNEGKARPPKFDNQDDLNKHYADEHPALAPPEIGKE